MSPITIINAEADSQHITRPVSYLWDENTENTFWSSDERGKSTTEETVVLHLKEAKPVCLVELYPCIIEEQVSYFPKDFTISVSADGEEWKDVCTQKEYVATGKEKQVFSFQPQADIKYVKLQMKNDSSYIRLSEVIIYATK